MDNFPIAETVTIQNCYVDEDSSELVAEVRLALINHGGIEEIRVPVEDAFRMDEGELQRHIVAEALAERGVGLHAPQSKLARAHKLAARLIGGHVVDDEHRRHARERAPQRRTDREARLRLQQELLEAQATRDET
jgi:hypothetical protein